MKHTFTLLVSVLFVLLMSVALHANASDPEVELDEDGNPIVKLDEAPEWVLTDGKGGNVSSADLAGQPYVLTFWATWCPYCKKFQPGLDYIALDYIDVGIPTYAVSFWENDGAKPAEEMEARGLYLPVLVEGDNVAKAFGVLGTPTTIFVNQDGEIVYRHTAFDPNDPQLRAAYEQLKDEMENPKPKVPEGEENKEDDTQS